MSNIQNNYGYDDKFDTLYYTIGDTSNSYGDEEPDNIVFLKDMNTDLLTGITILHFLKMYNEKDSRLNNVNAYLDVNQIARQLNKYT